MEPGDAEMCRDCVEELVGVRRSRGIRAPCGFGRRLGLDGEAHQDNKGVHRRCFGVRGRPGKFHGSRALTDMYIPFRSVELILVQTWGCICIGAENLAQLFVDEYACGMESALSRREYQSERS
jgi:hypothetical protein